MIHLKRCIWIQVIWWVDFPNHLRKYFPMNRTLYQSADHFRPALPAYRYLCSMALHYTDQLKYPKIKDRFDSTFNLFKNENVEIHSKITWNKPTRTSPNSKQNTTKIRSIQRDGSFFTVPDIIIIHVSIKTFWNKLLDRCFSLSIACSFKFLDLKSFKYKI